MLAELAYAVRSGKVSATELVTETLERIEANAELNAVVAVRADEALAEAAASGIEGSLAGIPVLVKDLEDVAGMRTTKGSMLHVDDAAATEDDIVCARLKRAGAIVVGKTNAPEYGFFGYTSNRVFGTTRNPWNPLMSPGGSSGGAAAALAAAITPIVTASDGGGSVRIPASLSGLVGYKPTFGAIGRSNVPAWSTFAMNGVLGRSVADTILEASAIMGWRPGDLHALAHGVALDPIMPSGVVAAPTFKAEVAPEIAVAFDAMCVVIETELTMDVHRVDRVFDTDPELAIAWLLIATAEAASELEWAAGREDELDPAFLLALTFGRNVAIADYIKAQRVRFEATAQLDHAIRDDSVLVVPTLNALAWPAEGPMPFDINGVATSALDALNTVEINMTGHPAVSVPMGVGPDGVPLGLQIVAPRYRDDLALGLAEAIERVRPWPTVAPGYEPYPSFD